MLSSKEIVFHVTNGVKMNNCPGILLVMYNLTLFDRETTPRKNNASKGSFEILLPCASYKFKKTSLVDSFQLCIWSILARARQISK